MTSNNKYAIIHDYARHPNKFVRNNHHNPSQAKKERNFPPTLNLLGHRYNNVNVHKAKTQTSMGKFDCHFKETDKNQNPEVQQSY